MRQIITAIGFVVFGFGSAAGGSVTQPPASCPLHAQHMKEAAQVPSPSHGELPGRGEQAMGFDQVATSHHFRLTPAGGWIEIHVNNATDTSLMVAVAQHLRDIERQFSAGDFSTPLNVHAETPDGVDTLKRLAGSVTYDFEPGSLGGRVRLTGHSAEAVAAIHQFLRYQIREHRTGDPLTVGGY